MLELQPFAGEEMSLPHTDARRDGFVEGERALAAQILALLDDRPVTSEETEVEDEMLLGR
jgi:hypothetical protein